MSNNMMSNPYNACKMCERGCNTTFKCKYGLMDLGLKAVCLTCKKMRPIPLSSWTLCWGSYWMMEW